MTTIVCSERSPTKSRALKMPCLLCLAVLGGLSSAEENPRLAMAKRIHDAEIKRADKEFEKAKERYQQRVRLARKRLLDEYEAAIKLATRMGDLERANETLAEKKAFEGKPEKPNGINKQQDKGMLSAPNDLDWSGKIPKGGFLRTCLLLGPMETEEADDPKIHEFVRKLKSKRESFQKQPIVTLRANGNKFFGTKKKLVVYYVFYVHSRKQQEAQISFNYHHSQTPKVFLNFKEIPRNSQLPIAKGVNVILVRLYRKNMSPEHHAFSSLQVRGEDLLYGK